MGHPNLNIISKFFSAYGKHDLQEIEEVLDVNARWIFPGRNPLSGTKQGIEEIVLFFDRMGALMAKSNIKVEQLVTGANDDYILECQHITTNCDDGVNLDHHWCVLWKFKNGKIVEGKHFAENQHMADDFFTKLIE